MELIVSYISVENNWCTLSGINNETKTSTFFLKSNEISDHIKDIFNNLEKDDKVIIIYKITKPKCYIYKIIKNIIDNFQ